MVFIIDKMTLHFTR